MVFYTTAAGKCPVKEFLGSLSGKEAKKVAWVIRMLERMDRVPAHYFKKLVGTEIWECRVETSTGAYRIFSFFFEGDTIVLTHGYSKKTRKTDRKEIERAQAYRQDYLKRHGRK